MSVAVAEALEVRRLLSANPIALYSTGSNGSSMLPAGSSDPQYTLSGNPAQVVYSNGFPLPNNWIADDSASEWIAPQANQGDYYDSGYTDYDYQMSFNVNGDRTSAVITGRWAADDSAEIFLNGNDTGIHVNGFNSLQPFTIVDGLAPNPTYPAFFVAGTNTLDFRVLNNFIGQNLNPTGLRVEFDSGIVQYSNTQMSVVNETASFGGALTLQANLAQSFSGYWMAPDFSQLVQFQIDGVAVGSAYTNSSGNATLTLNNFTAASAGSHTITATFATSSDAGINGSSATANLTVTQGTSSLAAAASEAGYDGTTTLTASMLSGSQSPAIAGEPINFSLNGTYVGTALTGAGGIASLSNVDVSSLNPGIYVYPNGIAASFAGDSNYSSSSVVASLTIPGNPYIATQLAQFGTSPGPISPHSTLTLDAQGNLYGTTVRGGTFNDGTIFEIPRGTSNVITLASFDGTDGANPLRGVVLDSAGNIYGATARGGGQYNSGTIYEVKAASATITVLALSPVNDVFDAEPLSIDSAGNVYGGSSRGYVWELPAGATSATFLATISGFSGGLVLDSAGDLFGTCGQGGTFGEGFVFEIPHGTTTVNTLASLNDGYNGISAPVLDASGNLYFSTSSSGPYPYGGVFEIPNGTSFVIPLAVFNNADGSRPNAITLDSASNIFGTTQAGGAYNDGTVFEIARYSYAITTIASLTDTDGSPPLPNGVTVDSAGNLYGTTSAGGALGSGTAFEMSPVQATQLAIVSPPTDSEPGAIGPVIVSVEDQNGKLVRGDDSTVKLSITSGPQGAVLFGTLSAQAVNGVATFNNLWLYDAGTYTLTASDGRLSQATTTSFTILPAAPAFVSITQQPASATVGQVISPAIQVEIMDAFGNVCSNLPPTPVTLSLSGGGAFTDDSTTTVSTSAGVASFDNIAPAVAGSYSLLASGGGLNATGAAIAVDQASTTITVTPPASPPIVGSLSPFVVQLTSGGQPVVGRDVRLFLTDTDTGIAQQYGGVGANLTGEDGTATFNLRISAAGNYTIQADFPSSSDAAYFGSQSQAVVFSVNAAASNTVVSAIPAAYGAPAATFTAEVSNASPGSFTPINNVGTVTFILSDGGAVLGSMTSGPLSDNAATVRFPLDPSMNTGQYTVEATYNPAPSWPDVVANFAASSGSALFTVESADTTLNLAPASSSAAYGSPITLNATLLADPDFYAPVSGRSINLLAINNATGADIITPAVSTSANGVATIELANLAVGTWQVQALFYATNDLQYNASQSNLATVEVTPAAPVVNWPTPAAIPFGTPLSATQLNATTSIPGTFTYSLSPGTILPVGDNTLQVTFTPADSTDYNPVTQSVALDVLGNATGPTVASGPITLTSPRGRPMTFSQRISISTSPGTHTLTLGGLPAGVTLTSVSIYGLGSSDGAAVSLLDGDTIQFTLPTSNDSGDSIISLNLTFSDPQNKAFSNYSYALT